MTHSVDVEYACKLSDLPTQDEFAYWVATAVGERRDTSNVTLRLVDEVEAEALNSRWLGKAYPTNVLAFPCERLEAIPEFLGDIVICAPLVLREAETQSKTATAHWAHLVIHGTLHLLGFDHDLDEDAEQMEGIEIDALARIGFSDPYVART